MPSGCTCASKITHEWCFQLRTSQESRDWPRATAESETSWHVRRAMNSVIADSLLSRRGILKLAGAALGRAILSPAQALAVGGVGMTRTIPKSGESGPGVGVGSCRIFDVTGE